MNQNPILRALLSILTPILFVIIGGLLFYTACWLTIGDPFSWVDAFLLEQRPDFSGTIDDIYHPIVEDDNGVTDVLQTNHTQGGTSDTQIDSVQSSGTSSQITNDDERSTIVGKTETEKNSLTNNKDTTSTVDITSITFPTYETIYGQIKCEQIGLDAPLIFGDSMNALDHGAAQSMSSFIPGYGGTILVGGHNYTYFNGLQNAEVGDIIEIDTSYGHYTYQVSDIKIDDKYNENAYPLTKDREQLILYTCYPFHALGDVSQRYFVYADYLSGPKITPQQAA